jgi:cell division transport system permease protein
MKEDKILRRRVRNSYVISTVSIALVLFLLGSVSYLMSAAMQVAHTLRENVTMSVELSPTVDSLHQAEIGARLQANAMVREVTFCSKQEKIGDAEFRRMFENEIEEVLEENPLNDSFEVSLTEESADVARVEQFVAQVESWAGVERASCPLAMIERMHATVGKVEWVLILFVVALAIISLILLSNTIRLSIYAKRYLINTMKLVGATKWFIMRPFLASSLWQGAIAGVVASLLFGASLYGMEQALPELTDLETMTKVAIIVGSMILSGVVVATLFTAVSVNRFVNMKSGKIHLY